MMIRAQTWIGRGGGAYAPVLLAMIAMSLAKYSLAVALDHRASLSSSELVGAVPFGCRPLNRANPRAVIAIAGQAPSPRSRIAFRVKRIELDANFADLRPDSVERTAAAPLPRQKLHSRFLRSAQKALAGSRQCRRDRLLTYPRYSVRGEIPFSLTDSR